MQTLLTYPDGKIAGVNKKKLLEYPFFLCTNPPDNSVTVPANGTPGVGYVMSVNGEGSAKVWALAHDASVSDAALIKIAIQEGEIRRNLCNNALHVGTIFGSGTTPYPMPEPIYIDELRQLVIDFTSISGSSNAERLLAYCSRATDEQVDPTLALARNRQGDKQFLSIPYFYTFDDGVVELTAGGTATGVITISEEAHFLLSQLSYVSDGRFSIDILDSYKGESIISAPQQNHYELPCDLILGNAGYPYCFSEGILIQNKQRLTVNITDLSGSANTVYLTLGGRALGDRLWR